jgi:hypothetical protein
VTVQNKLTEEQRERFVAAYMEVTGGSEEAARAIVDILLDPDPTRCQQGLSEWADEWRR